MTAKFIEFEKTIHSLFSSQKPNVIFEDFQIELVENGNPLPQYFIETKEEKYLVISKIKIMEENNLILSPSIDLDKNFNQEIRLDVDGSPLKLKDIQAEYCSLNPEYTKQKRNLLFYETYNNWLKNRCPISATQCRRLLSMFNAMESNISLELWALSGGNSDDIIFMSSRMILEEQKVNVQRVVEYLGTVESLINSINISKLLDEHYKNITTMQCKVRYMLFGEKYSYIKMSRDQNSFIEVEMSWITENIRVEKPPFSATTILNINIGNSSKDSLTLPLFNELRFLEELIKKYNNRLEKKEPIFDELTMKENWIDKVENLFDEYEMGGSYATKNDEAIFEQGFLNFKTRDGLDFTENLWQTMKGCLDVTEITKCISMVLLNIKNNTCQPVVANENWTALADLIRTSYTTKISKYQIAEFINDMRPLELLIEIGMYKIMQDYMLILFGENILLPYKYFDFFIKDFKNNPIEMRFDKLTKLNMIIELIYILQINKKLPDHTLEHVISVVLKNFEKKELNDCYLQSINIPTITIATGLDLTEAYFCSYNLKGDHEQMTFICTNYFPYHHIPLHMEINEETIKKKYFYISLIKQFENIY